MLRAEFALCLCLHFGCAPPASGDVGAADSGFHALDSGGTSPRVAGLLDGVDAGVIPMPATDPTLLLLLGEGRGSPECISGDLSAPPEGTDDLPPCELGLTSQYGHVVAQVGLRRRIEDGYESANGWESRVHELWLMPADGGAPSATVVLGYSSFSSTGDAETHRRTVDDAVLDGEHIVVTRRTRRPEQLRRHVAHGRLVLANYRGQLVPNNLGLIRTLNAETKRCLRLTSKPAPMTQGGPSCLGAAAERCVAIQNICDRALDIEGHVQKMPGPNTGTHETLVVAQPCVVPAKEHVLLQFETEPSAPEGFAFWIPRCKARDVSDEVKR